MGTVTGIRKNTYARSRKPAAKVSIARSEYNRLRRTAELYESFRVVLREHFPDAFASVEEAGKDLDIFLRRARKDYKRGNFLTHMSAKSLLAELGA